MMNERQRVREDIRTDLAPRDWVQSSRREVVDLNLVWTRRPSDNDTAHLAPRPTADTATVRLCWTLHSDTLFVSWATSIKLSQKHTAVVTDRQTDGQTDLWVWVAECHAMAIIALAVKSTGTRSASLWRPP